MFKQVNLDIYYFLLSMYLYLLNYNKLYILWINIDFYSNVVVDVMVK